MQASVQMQLIPGVSLFVRLWVEMVVLNWATDGPLVSLFVRLWVEMVQRLSDFMRHLSASSWGCELKYCLAGYSPSLVSVSLFVRLWVEILVKIAISRMVLVSLFVRLWVEISFKGSAVTLDQVSLFVRLWVEMQILHADQATHPSASSWGCELKYQMGRWRTLECWSASSWGCELKFCDS